MSSIPSLRKSLLHHFPLRTFDIAVGAAALSITAPEDLEELVNRITNEEFQKDERIPYWADVWHSAIALGEFIKLNPLLVADRRTLELGCGLGLCGIVAAQCGAEVTFSDYDEHALLCAELNFRTNLPQAEAEFLALDFRKPPAGKWERIIAADIIYEWRFIEPLLDCVESLLDDDGVLFLAHPNREISEVLVAKLLESGFVTRGHILPASYNAHDVDVRIEVITRINASVAVADINTGS
jgi:predicted nicotinamide N-methyase